MVSHVDMTVIKKVAYTHKSLETRGTVIPCVWRGAHGEASGWSGGRGRVGKMRTRTFIVVSAGKHRQGSLSRLRIG